MAVILRLNTLDQPTQRHQRLSAPDASQSRRLQHLNVSAIAAPELGTPDAIAGTAAGDPGKYQNTDWASAFTSQLHEYDYWVTDVEGVVPDTLRGTLFRNGPGRFERGEQKYEHMLDGDGYVCSFSFNDEGRMHFRSAYVRTSELEKEAEADAVLYRNTFGTQPRKPWGPLQNAFDLYLKNPANTNVVLWGDRLLALWEAGCPFEMDPHTLETHPGPETLGGFLRSGIAPSTTGADFLDKAIGLGKACTAHPHVVHGQGTSDRLAIFSWQSQIKPLAGSEMTIDINEFDENWQKVAGQKFTMHKSFFNPHDFAVSKNYYVFFQNAMSFKMGQYLLGLKGPAQCVNFEDGPMKVHLVPRNGDKPIVIDGVEPSFLIHHANAYEEGEEVVVWSSGWSPEAVRVLATSSGSGMLGSWKVVMDGDFNDVPVSSLWSHRINTRTGEVKRHCLFAQSNDHPRVNPSFYSRPTRYVYVNMCMTEDADISNPPQAFTRVDTHTGEAQTWFPGRRCFCEELVFVPGPNAATKEDDGYLLGLVYDAAKHKSFLSILDASNFSKGPVAKLWLKHHVPHGLHGFFSPKYFGPES
ncbi:hypothetical protein WJX82_008018 [Trebouxia sp. C0006]